MKENPPIDKSIPGPAAYVTKTAYTERAAAAYSFRPNTSYSSIFNDPTKHYPGPGSYNGHKASENNNGFYAASKYRSAGRAVISKSGSRFDKKDHRRSVDIPGPG